MEKNENEWNDIKQPPTVPMWYQVKLKDGTIVEVPFVKRINEGLCWLVPDISQITHWRENNYDNTDFKHY